MAAPVRSAGENEADDRGERPAGRAQLEREGEAGAADAVGRRGGVRVGDDAVEQRVNARSDGRKVRDDAVVCDVSPTGAWLDALRAIDDAP